MVVVGLRSGNRSNVDETLRGTYYGGSCDAAGESEVAEPSLDHAALSTVVTVARDDSPLEASCRHRNIDPTRPGGSSRIMLCKSTGDRSYRLRPCHHNQSAVPVGSEDSDGATKGPGPALRCAAVGNDGRCD